MTIHYRGISHTSILTTKVGHFIISQGKYLKSPPFVSIRASRINTDLTERGSCSSFLGGLGENSRGLTYEVGNVIVT